MDGHIWGFSPTKHRSMAHSGADTPIVQERRGRKRKHSEERGESHGEDDNGGPPLIQPWQRGDESDEKLDLNYEAYNAVLLLTPVALCMTGVVATISFLENSPEKGGAHVVYRHTRFQETSNNVNTRNVFTTAVLITAIIIGAAVVLAVAFSVAYKLRWYRAIQACLFFASLLLIFLLFCLFLHKGLMAINLAMDCVTTALIVWNLGMICMISIHWKAPLLLRQSCLIVFSAMISLVFIIYLPEWTTWAILGGMTLWDLFSVLAPCGPARILVETAEGGGEQIFQTIIYSAGEVYTPTGVGDNESDGNPRPFVVPSRRSKRLELANAKRDEGSNITEGNLHPLDQADPSSQLKSPEKTKAMKDDRSNATESNHHISHQAASSYRSKRHELANATEDEISNAIESNHHAQEQADTSRQLMSLEKTNARKDVSTTVHSSVQTAQTCQSKGLEEANITEEDGTKSDHYPDRTVPSAKGDHANVEVGWDVQLGLADFVYYSVLVGKASTHGDWNTTVACFVAILIGLLLTLASLSVFQRALPALPLSIALGLAFYFLTREVITPFADAMSTRQVFI